MRVVIVGAGRIGCGYLAPLFADAGWAVTLAVRSAEVARRIRAARSFGVRATTSGGRLSAGTGVPPGAGQRVEVTPSGCVGVHDDDFVDAVQAADLICTAVGVGNVGALGDPLARALAGRRGPADVWVVENGDCAPVLEAAVRAAAAARKLPLPQIGVAGAVAEVAVARGNWRRDEYPEFLGDAARRLHVDAGPLHNEVPPLPGVSLTSRYAARLEEKLHVFNAGHAICAYLGWLRGHSTIAQAVADSYLHPMVVGCLLESRRALITRHPELGSEVDGAVAVTLERFADDELADPIPRVARDPIRKLAPGDRLLGPAKSIGASTGKIPAYFSLGVAGALLYREHGDAQARELQQKLDRMGVMDVLHEVCGLRSDEPFALSVAGHYRGFIFTPDETLFPPIHAGGPGSRLAGLGVAGSPG